MELMTGLVFVVVFLISYYIYTKPKNLPPGPPGLPLLGNLFLVKQFRHRRAHFVLAGAAKKYGNVMSFRLGRKLFVVLTGHDAVHEALVKQAEVFSDRPDMQPLDFGGIIVQKYGDTWRMLRRFTLQSLRDFGVGKTSLEEKIFTELEVVCNAFQESDGRPISTMYYTQRLIGNVLLGIVFGKRYDYDDPELDRIRTILSSILTGPGFVSVSRFLPKFLARLISKSDVEAGVMRISSIRQVRKYIADEISKHKETFDKNNIRDFIDIYLQTKQETGNEQDNIEMANMFRVIMDLVLAGSKTTYTTLDWCHLYMSDIPEIQAKCQKELDEVIGDKLVQYSGRGSMPYLEVTLMEIQRVSMIAAGLVSNAACFGDVATNATKMYIDCGASGVIRILNVTAGAKATSTGCPASFSDTATQDIACCSPSSTVGDDCEFELQDKANFETTCNDIVACEVEAKNELTGGHCTADYRSISLYMYIQYECVREPTQMSTEDTTGSMDIYVAVGVVAAGLIIIGLIVTVCVYLKKSPHNTQAGSKVAPDVNNFEANEASDSPKLQNELAPVQII